MPQQFRLANYEEMTFGEYLDHIGVGVRAFARAVGVDPATITHLTRGRHTPNGRTLQKIRAATGLPEGTILRMVENARNGRHEDA